jgi:hypothetical protein
MKNTARSSGFFYVKTQLGWFDMSNDHSGSVFDAEGGFFQALCVCGWLSTVSYFEEVDLLRAMHVHAHATFKSYQN